MIFLMKRPLEECLSMKRLRGLGSIFIEVGGGEILGSSDRRRFFALGGSYSKGRLRDEGLIARPLEETLDIVSRDTCGTITCGREVPEHTASSIFLTLREPRRLEVLLLLTVGLLHPNNMSEGSVASFCFLASSALIRINFRGTRQVGGL